LDIGAQLGGRAATAGANVGQSLLTGGMAAARTQQASAGYSPEAGLLYGVANSPRLQTSFRNLLGGQRNYFDNMGNEFTSSGTPIYDY
jgi:hypothetical protein